MIDEQKIQNEIHRRLNRIQTLATEIETDPEIYGLGFWGKKRVAKKCQEIQDHCQWIAGCIPGPYDTEPGGDYYDTEPGGNY
jgi:hypothetical protein